MNALNWSGRALIGIVAFAFIQWAGTAGQSSADENAIRKLVEGYLNAKDWKERLVFVQDPSKQESAMQMKYQGAQFQLQNPAVQRIEQMEKLSGTYLVKASWREKPKNQAFSGYYVVAKGADGYKIDWPASVGYNAVSLKSLVMQKPKGPHALRLIATADSKFLDEYAMASDTHFCFLLKEDNPLQTIHGYVRRDNADGQRLQELLKRRQETKDRVIVEIQFVGPGGQDVKSGRTVAITKLVSDTWVLGL